MLRQWDRDFNSVPSVFCGALRYELYKVVVLEVAFVYLIICCYRHLFTKLSWMNLNA